MTEKREQQESNFPNNIGAPARNALVAAGYIRLEQLAGVSEAELKKLHGVGPTGISRLKAAMNTLGLSFAPDKK